MVPTYLYIKQHSITKKCYFGKTVKDPRAYMGSGKHWKTHIRVHGKQFVETLWCHLFTDREYIERVALMFSAQQDIVNSDKWLNQKPENGLDGGFFRKHSPESIEKMRVASIGVTHSKDSIERMADKLRGRPKSEAHKAKIAACRIGKKHSVEVRAKMSASRRGSKMSPESIEKSAAHRMGKPRSTEVRAKISAALTGRKHTDETRKKMSANHKSKKSTQEGY